MLQGFSEILLQLLYEGGVGIVQSPRLVLAIPAHCPNYREWPCKHEVVLA